MQEFGGESEIGIWDQELGIRDKQIKSVHHRDTEDTEFHREKQ